MESSNTRQHDFSVAVIIATKNRAEAVRTISLPSLDKSAYRDFICVIWDASENGETRKIAERGNWSFEISYTKAPRGGLTSQRNDAVLYVHSTWPGVKYVVFIDDDTELSEDVLDGITASFQINASNSCADAGVWGVSIPFMSYPYKPSVFRRLALYLCLRLHKVQGRGIFLPFLYFYMYFPEKKGASADWARGCGMAYCMEVFTELKLRFPEAFQHFSGYAPIEDVAFSFYLTHKLKRKIINSVRGECVHHSIPGGRSDTRKFFASQWFNLRLLFDEIYDHYDRKSLSYFLRLLAFRFFHLARFTGCALSGSGLDVYRGLILASRALRERTTEKQSVFRA